MTASFEFSESVCRDISKLDYELSVVGVLDCDNEDQFCL